MRFALIAYILAVVLLFVCVVLAAIVFTSKEENACEQQYPALTQECKQLYSVAKGIQQDMALVDN